MTPKYTTVNQSTRDRLELAGSKGGNRTHDLSGRRAVVNRYAKDGVQCQWLSDLIVGMSTDELHLIPRAELRGELRWESFSGRALLAELRGRRPSRASNVVVR